MAAPATAGVNANQPIEKCRSCQAPIVWVKTAAGKSMPVDAGSVTVGDLVYDPTWHVSHFATCPNAKQHRSR